MRRLPLRRTVISVLPFIFVVALLILSAVFATVTATSLTQTDYTISTVTSTITNTAVVTMTNTLTATAYALVTVTSTNTSTVTSSSSTTASTSTSTVASSTSALGLSPTTVATSTNAGVALGIRGGNPKQASNGYCFIFYFNGVQEKYISSNGCGSTWSSETTIPTACANPYAMIFTVSGLTVYYACSSRPGVIYNTGTISGGSITWSTEAALSVCTSIGGNGPTIVLDSSGQPWIFGFDEAGTFLYVCADIGGTWKAELSEARTVSTHNGPIIDAFSGGGIAILYGDGTEHSRVYIQECSGDGCAWTSPIATANGGYEQSDMSTAAIGTTVEACALIPTADNQGGSMYYLSFVHGSSSWTETRLAQSVVGYARCGVTTDGVSTLAIFYADSTSDLSYFLSTNSGASFSASKLFSSTEPTINTIVTDNGLFSSGIAYTAWVRGNGPNYDIRVAGISASP